MCPSTPKYCEVFFKPGMLNGKQVNSCADYCASRGLKCVYSYTPAYSQCSSFILDKDCYEAMRGGWKDIYQQQRCSYASTESYHHTYCDAPRDNTDTIGCICGKYYDPKMII